MGNKGSLGQWPNAPLALVLAQVRFEQFINIENQVAEFQKAIAADFPRIARGGALGVSLKVNGLDPLPANIKHYYQFTNAEKTKSINVDDRGLTYTVSSYCDYEQFSAELTTIVSAFTSVTANDLFVTQIGMRYVDFISPSTGKSLSDYVVPQIADTPTLGTGSPEGGLSILDFPYERGYLRLQWTTAYGRPNLPEELSSGPLDVQNKTPADYPGLTAVLDCDRIIKTDCRMTNDEIMSTFKGMHSDLSDAFKKVTTASAQQEWQERT